MHPRCILTINGTPVAGVFWERLVSVQVTDREGHRSDTIALTLEDGLPHATIPDDGDIIQCWLGYAPGVDATGLEYMGRFKITDVDIKCLPYLLEIKGEAADMTAKLKEHKERHWDNKKVRDIVGQVATEAGLTAQVSGKVGDMVLPWWGQQNESGLHMLQELADRHNALFTIKDGKVLFAERGAGQSVGGAALPPLILTPSVIKQGTCTVSKQKRSKHKSVSAEYYDRDEAKRKRETEPGEDKSEAEFTLRHAFSGKDEAKRAAKSRSKYLKREGERTAVEIEGNPTAKAGRPMAYAGVRPGVDGTVYVIEEASHTFSKKGYTTSLKGKVKDEQGGGAGGSGGG